MKILNIHKIMLIILSTILLFACDDYSSSAPLNNSDIKQIEEKCDSFGGAKSFLIKSYTEYEDRDCVRMCNSITYYIIDYVICNDGTIIQKYDDPKKFGVK